MTFEIFILLCFVGIGSIFIYENFFKKEESQQFTISVQEDSPEIRKIKTYFFTKNLVDYNKFCDYILCIKENMSLTDYTNMILELDLFVKCVPDLLKEVFPIILYAPDITEISYKDFEQVQDNIRENKYTNSTINFVYILIVTMLYLKNTVKEKRNNV